jgi:hypothetical protein
MVSIVEEILKGMVNKSRQGVKVKHNAMNFHTSENLFEIVAVVEFIVLLHETIFCRLQN